MEMMAALDKLPLNAFLLRKNPHIILTLRKVHIHTYISPVLLSETVTWTKNNT